jgi:protein involved in polysaccharide export with SLBB domain
VNRTLLCIALALALTGVAPGATLPVNPVIHAGDRLHVQVGDEDAVSQTVVVADDGTIGLPLAGEIHVAGATPDAAEAAIASALGRYIRDPHVTVSVIGEGHVTVMVLGDVVNSGSYALRPGARLSDAITAAGGMDPSIDGVYPVARIALADGTTYHISLDKLFREGDPTRDVALPDRAAVYVPGPTTFDITVLGAVDRPGTLAINDGDRLSLAIAKAGDTQASKADLTRVVVTRTEADGTTASHPVDLYQSLERGDTRFDPRLRKGDIVFVPLARQSHGNLTNAVFLIARLAIFL